MQSSVTAASTRVLIQNALQRYNDDGNNTASNWVKASSDLMQALTGTTGQALLLQAKVLPNNNRQKENLNGLVNVTSDDVLGTIALPYNHPNGSRVYLGDQSLGYPALLYPNITYGPPKPDNSSNAIYEGSPLSVSSSFVLGPYQLNATYALLSLTVPINNNTSRYVRHFLD